MEDEEESEFLSHEGVGVAMLRTRRGKEVPVGLLCYLRGVSS